MLRELPHQAHHLFPGDPAGTLEQEPEESIKCDDLLLPHLRHDISFMPTHRLKSTQPGLGRNGGVVLVAQTSPQGMLIILLSHSQQNSRLPDPRNVHEMMDGWEHGQGMQSFTSHDICELVPHVPGIRTQNLNNGIFEKNKAILITRSNQEEPRDRL